MSDIKHFLLVFDHSKNELILEKDFGTDIDSATDEYARQEQAYRDSNVIDIVLIGSDSVETVKVTHSTYFEKGHRGQRLNRLDELSNYLHTFA